MKIRVTTVRFKSGREQVFPNAGFQYKDNRRIVAIYDWNRYCKIFAEFSADEIDTLETNPQEVQSPF